MRRLHEEWRSDEVTVRMVISGFENWTLSRPRGSSELLVISLDDLFSKFKNLTRVRVNFWSPADDMQVDKLKIEFIHFNIQI